MEMDIKKLFELDELARKAAGQYTQKRDLFKPVQLESGRHFIGIVGPRGAGKTVLLKQLAAHIQHSFYIALDTLGDGDIFTVAHALSEHYGIKTLLLDEVHFQKDFDEKLKKIFDFLNIRVIFTSSVALSMFKSAYDLSRRIRLAHLHPFTFREYVRFKTGDNLSPLSLDALLQNDFPRELLRYEYLFDAYIRGGLMPFSLEEPDVLPLLENVLRKVITSDIPSIARLAVDELAIIEKTVAFIGRSGIDGINYSSISRNIGITKYKAEQYIELLTKAFILNPAFPAGTNVLREPKVLMHLPYRLLFRSYNEAVGGLREDFFAHTMQASDIPFQYLKSTRGEKTPDYLLKTAEGSIIVEIGGKGKGRQQFKGISGEKMLVLSHGSDITGIKRPLFLLGFLM